MFARKGKAGRSSGAGASARLALAATIEDDAEDRLPLPASRRSSTSTAVSAMLSKGSVRRASTTRVSSAPAAASIPSAPAPAPPPPGTTTTASVPAGLDGPAPIHPPAAQPPTPPPKARPPSLLQPASAPPELAPAPPSPPSPPSSWRVLGRRHTMPRLMLDTRLSPIVSSVSPKGSPPSLGPHADPLETATSAAATRTNTTQQHDGGVRADAPNPFLSSPVGVPLRRAPLPIPPTDPHLQEWSDWSAELRVREAALRERELALSRREETLRQREIVAAVHAKGLQRLGLDVSTAAVAAELVATPTEMSPRAPLPAAPTPLRPTRETVAPDATRRGSASSAPMPARSNLLAADAAAQAHRRAGSYSQTPAAAYPHLASRRSRTSPLPLPRATSPTQTITTATPGATASESEALISTLLAEIDTLTQSLSVAQGEIAQREADYERLERRHADALGSYEGERQRWAELEGQRDAVEDELKARVAMLEQMLAFDHMDVAGEPGPSDQRPGGKDGGIVQADQLASVDEPQYYPSASNEAGYAPKPLEERTVGNWVLGVHGWGGKGKGKWTGAPPGSSGTTTDDTNTGGTARPPIAHVVRRGSFGVGDDDQAAGPSGEYARGAAEREWEREEAEREAALKRARNRQQQQLVRHDSAVHRSSTPISDLLLSPHDAALEWAAPDDGKKRV